MDKPIFLFINLGGDFLSPAIRVKDEGYSVYFSQTKSQIKGREDTGKGFFAKNEFVDDPFEVINRFPKEQLYILYDDNGRGDTIDFLRRQGYKVLGGGSFADDIEYKREMGTKLMEKIGLKVPETNVFTSLNEGMAFAEKQKDEARFIFKPSGEDYAGSARTYGAKNKEDLMAYLKWTKEDSKEKHYTIEKFELQEFIDGYEADFSMYFDGEKWMRGSGCWYFEEKKSGDGNKGEAIGCAGATLFFVKKSPYQKYLDKMVPLLKNIGYVGQMSINNIFSKKDGQPYGLEFTPRCIPSNEEFIVRYSGKEIKRSRADIIFRSVSKGLPVEIMTPSGFSKIVDYASKKYQGKYVRFKLENGATFTVTAEHEIPVAGGLKKAEEIELNDRILFMRQSFTSDRGTYDLGRFVGLFLAEGNKSPHNNGIHFTFNKREKELADFVISFGKTLGASYGKYDYKPQEGWFTVSLFSKGIYNLLGDFIFGKTARTKRLTGKVFEMSEEFRKGVIRGWTEGDGHAGQGKNTFIIDTYSRYLALDAQDLINSVGYEYVVHHYKNGRRSLKPNEWRWRIVYNLKKFNKSYSWSSTESDYYIPIKKIWINKYKKPVTVYDFKVENENHLITLSNGIVIHNCGWDAHMIELALHGQSGLSPASFYLSLLNKKDFKFNDSLVATGVRIYTGSISLKKEEVSGRYLSFPPKLRDDLWFYSLSTKDDYYMVEDNPVLVATAVDKTINGSIRKVYKEVIPQINLADIYFRTEIGQRVPEAVAFLRKHGWL